MNRAVVITVLVAFGVLGAVQTVAQSRTDEVAVVVNGEPISTWELKLLVPQIRAEMASQGLDTKGSDVVRTTMQRAIDSRLLAQEARSRGLQPNQQRVDQKMNSLAEAAGGRAALEANLVKSGLTYDQLRSTAVEADLVRSLVETEIAAGIEVTDADVVAFYSANPELFTGPEKIHARHILLLVDADADAEQREAVRRRAQAARERALAGEDFAALAVELSEGPNASKGGDLGFTARGQMVEAFDEAVWQLEPGEISDVVESHIGFHVIKVEEIIPGSVVPLDDARPLVTDLLRQKRTAEALTAFVAELRAEADIREPVQ